MKKYLSLALVLLVTKISFAEEYTLYFQCKPIKPNSELLDFYALSVKFSEEDFKKDPSLAQSGFKMGLDYYGLDFLPKNEKDAEILVFSSKTNAKDGYLILQHKDEENEMYFKSNGKKSVVWLRLSKATGLQATNTPTPDEYTCELAKPPEQQK